MTKRNWILILLAVGAVVITLLVGGCYTATFVDDESDCTPYVHVYAYPYTYSYGHMWGVYGYPGWYPYYYYPPYRIYVPSYYEKYPHHRKSGNRR